VFVRGNIMKQKRGNEWNKMTLTIKFQNQCLQDYGGSGCKSVGCDTQNKMACKNEMMQIIKCNLPYNCA